MRSHRSARARFALFAVGLRCLLHGMENVEQRTQLQFRHLEAHVEILVVDLGGFRAAVIVRIDNANPGEIAGNGADDERAADSTTDLDSRLNYLAQQERALAIEKAIRSAAMPNQKMIEWEIELASPEAFVTISAPEDAKDDQLLALACDEATRKTYIWSKKRTNPPNIRS